MSSVVAFQPQPPPGSRRAVGSARRPSGGPGPDRTVDDREAKEARRVRIELESLKRENDHLKSEIAAKAAAEEHELEKPSSASKHFLAVGSTRKSKRAAALEAKRRRLRILLRQVEGEECERQEVDDGIANLRSSIKEMRVIGGGCHATKAGLKMIDAQHTVLEDRVEYSLKEFNRIVRENKADREAINGIRRERDVFESIYTSMESELSEKKKEMAFVIEVSNLAYEERDNCLVLLEQAKSAAAEEMRLFEETFAELDRMVEEDRRVKNEVANRMRLMDKQKEAGPTTRSPPKPLPIAPLAPALGHSGRGGPRRSVLALTPTLDQRRDHCVEAIEQIRIATNSVVEPEHLALQYTRQEDMNFGLFKHLNTLADDEQAIKKECEALAETVNAMSSGSVSELQVERTAILRGLEKDLAKEESANKGYVDAIEAVEGVLRRVLAQLEHMFNVFDCDDTQVQREHGVTGMTHNNVLLYFAILERKANEMLLAHERNADTVAEKLLPPPNVAKVVVDLRRIPKTQDDEFAAGSEDERILTLDELKAHAQKALAQQGAFAAKPPAQAKKQRPKRAQ